MFDTQKYIAEDINIKNDDCQFSSSVKGAIQNVFI